MASDGLLGESRPSGYPYECRRLQHLHHFRVHVIQEPIICVVLAFGRVFTPIPAKRRKHLSLVDILAVGVDRMQRNCKQMGEQLEAWKETLHCLLRCLVSQVN